MSALPEESRTEELSDAEAAPTSASVSPPTPAAHKTASQMLREALARCAGDDIPIRDLIHHFDDRAWGLVNLVFALPNCIPLPPGIASAFGLPMMFFGGQMARGDKHPWLPAVVGNKTIRRESLELILNKAEPKLNWLEKFCRPRLSALAGPVAERWIGAFIALCGFSVLMPAPGSNMVPSLGVVLLSLGLLEDDGLFILLGVLVGMTGMIVVVLIYSALLVAMLSAFFH